MAFVVVEQLGSLLVPFGLTFRRCKIHFMLRAAALHSLLRRILRFSTSSRPEALGACYVASWQLPRPDSHRLANDDFQGTPMIGWAARARAFHVLCPTFQLPLVIPVVSNQITKGMMFPM